MAVLKVEDIIVIFHSFTTRVSREDGVRYLLTYTTFVTLLIPKSVLLKNFQILYPWEILFTIK